MDRPSGSFASLKAAIFLNLLRVRPRRKPAIKGLLALTPFLFSCRGATPTSPQVRALAPDALRAARPPATAVVRLPPRGEMAPAALDDGTPVWVVRDMDDAVTLVVPFATDVDGQAMLVPWWSDTKSFRNRFVWDSHGRLLANAGWSICLGECPRVSSLPTRGRDFDTYAARPIDGDPERAEVGERIRGREHDIPQEPLWPELTHSQGDARRWPDGETLSIAAALARPDGAMVLLDADAVLLSGDAPRICRRASHDPPCPPGSPRIYDMDGAPARGRKTVHTIVGPIYARRFRDGFVQVAAREGLSSDSYVAAASGLVAPATMELSPWLFAAGGVRSADGSNRAIASLGGGLDLTFGIATFGSREAYGGQMESRFGPWSAVETSTDRVRAEGGVGLSLGQVRHAQWGTVGLRAGAGYGSDGSPHVVGMFTWGVRYVPGRNDPEHDACNPSPFAFASGARFFAAVRRAFEPQVNEFVFGLEFEPTWFLPPYSLFKWGGSSGM